MTIRLQSMLVGLLAGLSLGLLADSAVAQDRDSYIAQAKAFGMDIGHASFCELDGEKLKAFADAGMAENLPAFDDEEFSATILAEFEAAMRGAAEVEPEIGCEAHLAKVAAETP